MVSPASQPCPFPCVCESPDRTVPDAFQHPHTLALERVTASTLQDFGETALGEAEAVEGIEQLCCKNYNPLFPFWMNTGRKLLEGVKRGTRYIATWRTEELHARLRAAHQPRHEPFSGAVEGRFQNQDKTLNYSQV